MKKLAQVGTGMGSIKRAAIAAVLVLVAAIAFASPAEARQVSATNQDISAPSVTTTDPASNPGQALVNDLSSTSEVQWYATGSGTGEFTAYLTAEGSDGNTYVSSSFSSSTGRSIIDDDSYSNLELHLIYKNGSTSTSPLLLIGRLGSKGLQFDDSRDIEVASSSDAAYSVTMASINNQGKYYDYDTYVSNGLDPDDIYAIYLRGTIAANDIVEVTVPVKKGSDTTDSSFYSYSLTDYSVRKSYYLQVAFSSAVNTLSTSSTIELIPSVYLGNDGVLQKWEPQSDLYDDMPDDVFSVLKFTNFRSSASSSLVALTDDPLTIYKTAEYTVDLTEIESNLTQHGWTVQFNNGEPMSVYTYTTISSNATFTDNPDPSGSTSSSGDVTYIQVSVVPAILVGDAQTYMQGEMPDDWDPTSLVTHFYKADYDSGGTTVIALDDLEEYDKSNLNVSYAYTAYGSDDAVEVDGVDDSKPGTYLVTFSYDYSGTTIYNRQYVYINPVTTETKDVTRTINVHNPDGTTDTTTQTATLTRTVTTDVSTGEVSYGEWSTGTWDSFTAPEIDGYEADPASVSAATVTADTEDATVDITYAAVASPAGDTPEGSSPSAEDSTGAGGAAESASSTTATTFSTKAVPNTGDATSSGLPVVALMAAGLLAGGAFMRKRI